MLSLTAFTTHMHVSATRQSKSLSDDKHSARHFFTFSPKTDEGNTVVAIMHLRKHY